MMPWLGSVLEVVIQCGLRRCSIHTNAGEKGLLGKVRGGQLGKANKKWFLCSDKTGGLVLPRQCAC